VKKILITGGSGFFGGILKRILCEKGMTCVSIDIEKDDDEIAGCTSVQGDIRDANLMRSLFKKHKFDAVIHCAAMLAHAVKDTEMLWTSNVDGTKVVADCCQEFNVQKIIFISSNCLWGEGFKRPVREDDEPCPIEIYGKSKWEGEKILLSYPDIHSVIFRSPTIIDEGRLGLLAILFEFMDEGRKVWVVGGGDNRYQFIYAKDLADACIRALDYQKSEIFNIGSDNVQSFKNVYQYVIDKAGTGARVANFPRSLAIPAMKIAYALGLSPLGPYQYKMIAENFEFDTSKIKQKLKWKPTVTNEEMLWRAYEYYHKNREEIMNRTNVSAHKQPAKMGVIQILKWFS
jgi:nucleoside-diphosphate-sugar epimerase